MRLKRSLVYTFFILCLALYLRLRFVIYTPFEFKIDAWSMYHYALNVAEGKYYGHRFGEHWSRYAYWPPLYIFLSGLVYRFFGISNDYLVMRMLQAGFSAASCLLCYSIASESLKGFSAFHREAGLAAGVLMALNPRMVVYTNHLYVETVFIAIYLSLCLFVLKYFKYELPPKPGSGKTPVKTRYLLLSAFFLGIGNLTRPILLLLPVVIFVCAFLYAAANRLEMRRIPAVLFKDAIVALAVMLVVMSPWIIRNYAVTGRLILIDTNGPINFYIAHNPLANGQWVDVKPHTDINRLYETGYSEGLAYIAGNIPEEIRLLRFKQRLFLYHGDPHITEAEKYLERTYKLPFYGSLIRMGIVEKAVLERIYRFPRMSFTFLWKTAFALLALFVLRLSLAGSLYVLLCGPAWIIGNFLYNNLIILIFYFAPRYRIPAEPFLCILIGILSAGFASPRFRAESSAN